MEKREGKGKGRSIAVFLHAMFTALLLLGIAHIQIRMTQHITQQERENADIRELLNKHVQHMKSVNEANINSQSRTGEKERFQNEIWKPKEETETENNVGEDNENVDVQPLTLRIKRETKAKCCDEKGSRGRKGQKGNKGKRGRPGAKGEKGDTGDDGQDGNAGPQGKQGAKGDKGRIGATGMNGRDGTTGKKGWHGVKGDKGEKGVSEKRLMLAESAHVVGRSNRIELPHATTKNVYLLNAWEKKHESGQMSYLDGYLTVGVEGYYYIYCQIYYKDGRSALTGYKLYIDETPVIKASNSVVSIRRKYDTNYVGGVFYIKSSQTISVRTDFHQYFSYGEAESFFGAFMIHS